MNEDRNKPTPTMESEVLVSMGPLTVSLLPPKPRWPERIAKWVSARRRLIAEAAISRIFWEGLTNGIPIGRTGFVVCHGQERDVV